jgi:integrase
MNAVGKPNGLTRRKGSASWYYRQRCPTHLKSTGAPEEVWISLGTADYQQAIRQLEDAREEAARRFRGVNAPSASAIFPRIHRALLPVDPRLPILTSEQAVLLAKSFFQRGLLDLDVRPIQTAAMSREEVFDLRNELQDQQQALLGFVHEEEDDPIRSAQIAALRGAGLRSEPQSEAGLLFREYLRRAMVQLVAIRLARLDGDFSDRITDGLFLNGTGVETGRPPSPVHQPSVALGEAIGRYEAEVINLRNITDKASKKQRAFLKHIREHFGRKTPLAAIDRSACNQFRDLLAKLPPNFTKKRRPDQTLARVAEANKSRTLAWETQNNYLAALSNLLEWCVRERLVQDNAAKGILPFAKRDRSQKSRVPFTSEELAKIFWQPLFTGCKDDERGFAIVGSKVVRRSRYWLPLIGLFSGMRMEEILQLTPAHIRQSRAGNPFFLLTPDMKLKTDSAQREIPVHPMLVRLGLLDWIKEQTECGVTHLFEDVPESQHGYRSDIFSKRFATFLRSINLPAERRAKLCFHSFRHTFKDALNQTDAPEAEMEEICGWSRGKKTSRRYGSGLNADRLKPYVDQVSYDIDLSHLSPA